MTTVTKFDSGDRYALKTKIQSQINTVEKKTFFEIGNYKYVVEDNKTARHYSRCRLILSFSLFLISRQRLAC